MGKAKSRYDMDTAGVRVAIISLCDLLFIDTFHKNLNNYEVP